MVFTGPHDYFNPDYVREWEQSANSKRPFRVRFFDEFASQLSSLSKPKILDLGAGSGFLAEHLLDRCDVTSYHLFDFSPLMLELSRARLSRFNECLSFRISFQEGSFLEENWYYALPRPFDAVISIQAVHELRDTARIPQLYRELRSLLAPDGLLLVADEIAAEAEKSGPFETIAGHLSGLKDAGFEDVSEVLVEGDLAMFSARC
jgi:SAM-dependent methyltransferase